MQLIDFDEKKFSHLIFCRIQNSIYVFAFKLKDTVVIPVFKNEEKAKEFSLELQKSTENQLSFDVTNIPNQLLKVFYDYVVFYNAANYSLKMMEIDENDFLFYNEENSKNFMLIGVEDA